MNPPNSGAAATSAMTGAIRTESRKKSSGAIAKRACDQCKFRKIKASNILRSLRTPSDLGSPCLLFISLVLPRKTSEVHPCILNCLSESGRPS